MAREHRPEITPPGSDVESKLTVNRTAAAVSHSESEAMNLRASKSGDAK